MMRAYHTSAATSNLVRAFAGGGYGDLTRVKEWGMDWSLTTSRGRQYMATAERISEALSFIDTCGLSSKQPIMSSTEVYTSHEAILLPYEQALVRQDPLSANFYACSGHFLWIGERTRGIDDAHVEFARGISNRKFLHSPAYVYILLHIWLHELCQAAFCMVANLYVSVSFLQLSASRLGPA